MRQVTLGSQHAPRRPLASVLLVASAFLGASCGGTTPAEPSAPSKDFNAEARSSIDEKNMDAELNKLKAEIEADTK